MRGFFSWRTYEFADFLVTVVLGLTFLAEGASAGIARPLSSGIVYPTTPDAVATNPAALFDESSTTIGRLEYDPVGGYSGAVATASSSFGYGAALNSISPGMLTLGAGTSGNFGRIGVSLSLANTLNPADGQIGLGGIIGGLSGLRFGFTLSSLLKSEVDQLTVGIGYAAAKDFQVEFDLKSATSSLSAAGKPYTQTVAAMKYWTSVGLGVFESSAAGMKPAGVASPDIGVVGQFYLSSRTSIDLRYSQGAAGGFGLGALFTF